MRITISIPDNVHDALVKTAADRDRSLSYVVRQALNEHLIVEPAQNGGVPVPKATAARKRAQTAKNAAKTATPRKAASTKPTPKPRAQAVRARAKAAKKVES